MAKPPKVPEGASRADIANSVTDNAAFNVRQQAGSTILLWILATIPRRILGSHDGKRFFLHKIDGIHLYESKKNIELPTAQDLDELKLALTMVQSTVSIFDTVSIIKKRFKSKTILSGR